MEPTSNSSTMEVQDLSDTLDIDLNEVYTSLAQVEADLVILHNLQYDQLRRLRTWIGYEVFRTAGGSYYLAFMHEYQLKHVASAIKSKLDGIYKSPFLFDAYYAPALDMLLAEYIRFWVSDLRAKAKIGYERAQQQANHVGVVVAQTTSFVVAS